jgi:4-hydroxythreonine-4-phosphate dehydrogenase
MKTIFVTTGDFDGIGLEISLKAIASIKNEIPRNIQLLVFHKPVSQMIKYEELLLADLKKRTQKISNICFLEHSSRPAEWVYESARQIKKGMAHAIVTAPLSKPEIQRSGYKAVGHTEILNSVFPKSKLFMGFAGDSFNVLLSTGHKPIGLIESSLNQRVFFSAASAAVQLRQISHVLFSHHNNIKTKLNRPIKVLGLNPHAGDSGLIGTFEQQFLIPWLKAANQKLKVPFEGPMVPDVAFQKKYWQSTGCYLSMYHDQGLIPFKLVHNNSSSVHITMGLPFIRTSVDHGTAKDIFGQGVANSDSMKSALTAAISLVQRSITTS